MRVFTPKIAEQVINRGWHVATHEHNDYEGNIVVEQSVELDYDYCLPEAMRMLVDWQQQFQTFQASFKQIDADVAGKMARICCEYMFLPKLEALGASEAMRLSHAAEHILFIGVQTEPSSDAMQALFDASRENWIDIQLSTLSVENATVLANYPHEFFLELPFQALTPTVIAILSGHVGYRLNLRLTGFDGNKAYADEVLEVLSRTPCKRAICVYRSDDVVRYETEERDWGRWKRRMDRRKRVNDRIAG